MSDWTGGFGAGGRPAKAKIPAKVHRNVSLIRTSDRLLTEELLARSRLSQHIIGRLTDQVLLVAPGRVQEVIEELKRMGHAPKVVGTK